MMLALAARSLKMMKREGQGPMPKKYQFFTPHRSLRGIGLSFVPLLIMTTRTKGRLEDTRATRSGQ